MTQPVFRFAPSSNGRLHLGHAYSALLNADLAARWGGRLLLRMDDIDPTRCRPDFEAAIYDDLAWLGLSWEEPVRRQSEHVAEYGEALERLKAGGIVYPCFCTRKTIAQSVRAIEIESVAPWRRDPDGAPLYPGTCQALSRRDRERRVAAGEPHAWRLYMRSGLARSPGPHVYTAFDLSGGEGTIPVDPARWGDAVLARKEVATSYHLSVVLDDAVQGVTHVVRGRDLEAATDVHVLLQALLGVSRSRYHHHALIRDGGGDKLSKSLGSQSLADLRAQGVTADAIRRRLGFGDRADSDPVRLRMGGSA